jgi:hypothetical protein
MFFVMIERLASITNRLILHHHIGFWSPRVPGLNNTLSFSVWKKKKQEKEDSVHKLKKKGNEFYGRGEYDRAMEKYREACR